MKKMVAAVALALAVMGVVTGSAAAKTKHGCTNDGATTIAVRGMECAEGKATVSRVFQNSTAYSIPFNRKREFRTKGWSGTPVKVQRTFVCSVLYTRGTGVNRGGILLRVTCHDFNGDAVYYSEQQDDE